jgi:hypothetical protein
MDFYQLLAKMQELDQPVPETTTEMGCGSNPMPPMDTKPDEPPPSMSVNLNAQGMDNIEELLKLMVKVNPDMDKDSMPPLPSMGMEPSITSIKPSLPPLKMLPDLDKEGSHSEPDADNFGGPSDNDADNMPIKGLDRDGDGDHDMDDHDIEKKKSKEDEAFGNSLGNSEPEVKSVSDVVHDGNDLHKQKKSFSGKPYRGDNPMAAGAYESTDLRAQIRAELLQRLEEAKGAK